MTSSAASCSAAPFDLDAFLHKLIFQDTNEIHTGAWHRTTSWDLKPVESVFDVCMLCLDLPAKEVYKLQHAMPATPALQTMVEKCSSKNHICLACVVSARVNHLRQCPICRHPFDRFVPDDAKTKELARLKRETSCAKCPDCSQLVCKGEWRNHRLNELKTKALAMMSQTAGIASDAHLQDENRLLRQKLDEMKSFTLQLEKEKTEMERELLRARLRDDEEKEITKRHLEEVRRLEAEEDYLNTKRRRLLDRVLTRQS